MEFQQIIEAVGRFVDFAGVAGWCSAEGREFVGHLTNSHRSLRHGQHTSGGKRWVRNLLQSAPGTPASPSSARGTHVSDTFSEVARLSCGLVSRGVAVGCQQRVT